MQVEEIGVHPLDRRRVDVAVDLTPCQQPVDVEMVIVGPDDEEWCSILLIRNQQPALDKIMHLRWDAAPGEYTLHVGVFYEKALVARGSKTFAIAAEGKNA
jgi:hypothetical protein